MDRWVHATVTFQPLQKPGKERDRAGNLILLNTDATDKIEVGVKEEGLCFPVMTVVHVDMTDGLSRGALWVELRNKNRIITVLGMYYMPRNSQWN